RGLYTNTEYTCYSWIYLRHQYNENFDENFADSCCSGQFGMTGYVPKDLLLNGIGIKMLLTTNENVKYELIIKIKLIEKEEGKLFFDKELCKADITTNVYV